MGVQGNKKSITSQMRIFNYLILYISLSFTRAMKDIYYAIIYPFGPAINILLFKWDFSMYLRI